MIRASSALRPQLEGTSWLHRLELTRDERVLKKKQEGNKKRKETLDKKNE